MLLFVAAFALVYLPGFSARGLQSPRKMHAVFPRNDGAEKELQKDVRFSFDAIFDATGAHIAEERAKERLRKRDSQRTTRVFSQG